MKHFLSVMALVAILAGTSSCVSPKSEEISLATAYEDYFQIGAAIGQKHLEGYDTLVLKQHFSSITAENDMKPGRIVSEYGVYDFTRADRLVDFALRNDLVVRGHTLVWRNQTRDWFYRDSTGKSIGKEASLERMRDYIHTVLDHFRGRVYCWDVVNEAIGPQPQDFYRDSTDWFRACGPEFIEKAFVYAREADPEVQLFYNDYNLIDTVKARKVYQMARDFQERGIPIDGIGMQGHWTMEDNVVENLAYSIDLFASLGLEVHITELDLSLYPFYHDTPKEDLPRELIPMTPELEKKQAEKLAAIFEVLRERSEVVTSVTTWGVADNKTWLSNYFVKGRTDHPLLFDTAYQAKDAVFAILDF
jgi:endo-1,4-beta-xylanase